MKFSPDIIKQQVIDNLPNIILVSEIDDKILYVNCTYYVRVGTIFKDDNDVSFQVTEFVPNVSITVNNSGFVGNINLTIPTFFWGTQLATNKEYIQLSANSEEKLPMIWLLDNWTEVGYNRQDSRDYNLNVRLFFLDTSDPNSLNNEIKDSNMLPMFQLTNAFKKVVENNRTYFNHIGSWDRQPRTRFGTQTEQGATKRILDDDLTGCELTLSIDINKVDENCCLDTYKAPQPTCADGTVINSNGTYTLAVPSGETVELPDTNYDIYLDGVFKETVTLPTLDPTNDLNIILI